MTKEQKVVVQAAVRKAESGKYADASSIIFALEEERPGIDTSYLELGMTLRDLDDLCRQHFKA